MFCSFFYNINVISFQLHTHTTLKLLLVMTIYLNVSHYLKNVGHMVAYFFESKETLCVHMTKQHRSRKEVEKIIEHLLLVTITFVCYKTDCYIYFMHRKLLYKYNINLKMQVSM